jgi:hypothetical protein
VTPGIIDGTAQRNAGVRRIIDQLLINLASWLTAIGDRASADGCRQAH